MNMMPPPGSPLLLFIAAYAVLLLHIGGGLVGIGSGFTTMVLRKGSRAHAVTGQVFVVSMLIMAGIGAVVSPLLPQRANVVPALLTLYLVVTGWRSGRDRSGDAGAVEIGGLAFALCTVAAGLTFALDAAMSPTGLLDAEPSSTYLTFTIFPALAAALDVGVILRGRISRPHRIARHLWRMNFALFIAAGSLFLGQPKVFPAALRGAPIMFVPELVIIGALVFWMVRVLVFDRRGRNKPRRVIQIGELATPLGVEPASTPPETGAFRMTTDLLSATWFPRDFADRALKASGALWFLTAAVGQAVFAAYVAAFYWAATLQGHFVAWNRKEHIVGYVPHDTAGNLFFAAHVMIAALITTSGALQLVPQLRARAPSFHRWNGRFYVAVAFLMALGGLWMIWIRGDRLMLAGAFASTLLAVLIMMCASLTVRYAMARRFDIHHRWALRTFMVANGVWFQRLGYGAWIILNHGPRGIGEHMDGPFDLFLAFGCYLVPLAGLELYLRTRDVAGPFGKLVVAGAVAGLAVLTGVGVFGAYMTMWRPFLQL